MIEPHSSNFRVITTNVLGVRIFRKFTVIKEKFSAVHFVYTNLSERDHFTALMPLPASFYSYRNDPKFSDRFAWANTADPDQRSSLIRVYTVCHSFCIVWTHYSMVEQGYRNFEIQIGPLDR